MLSDESRQQLCIRRALSLESREHPCAIFSRSVLTYGVNRSTIILLVFGTTWTVFVTGLTLLCSTITQSDYGILHKLVTTK